MRRFPTTLLVLAALAAVAPAARGSDEILRIETAYLQAADHRPDRQDPSDRLAKPQPLQVALGVEPTPGTGRVPPGREHFYGQLDLGARPLPLVLAVQADGVDAVLDLAGTQARERGREGRSQGRAVVRWTFPGLALGAARVDVAVHRTAPDHQAVLVRGEAPAPITLSPSPRAGCRLFAPDTPVVGHGQVDGIDVAFARGEAERLTLLYDRNRNGVVGESGEVLPVPVAGRDGETTYWQAEGVAFPAGPAGVAFQEIPGEVVA